MTTQYYAVVPVTRENRDAAKKPLENAVALVYRDVGWLMSFRPKSGWTRSGSADADTVAGLGDDTAVRRAKELNR